MNLILTNGSRHISALTVAYQHPAHCQLLSVKSALGGARVTLVISWLIIISLLFPPPRSISVSRMQPEMIENGAAKCVRWDGHYAKHAY